MSYDIDLRCASCGQHPDRLNPTYNLSPIFDLALTGEPLPSPDVSEVAIVLFGQKTDRPRGLRVLDGRKGKDTVEALSKALVHLRDPAKREAFERLEPDNGWGRLETAVRVIREMLSLARDYPENVWRIN